MMRVVKLFETWMEIKTVHFRAVVSFSA